MTYAPKERSVNIQISARFYENGVTVNDTKAIWFVFHGYGQLAFYFLRNFEVLKEKGIRVIAPEGLHRYYLEGTHGRVGASWMTKEDRIRDIDNYISYINTVYSAIASEYQILPPVSALGFSQGAATVCRWVSQPQIIFQRLILWAGLFPPDLPEDTSRKILSDKEVYFIYGTKDPYLSDERFAEMEKLKEKLGIEPVVQTFDGKHTLDEATLLSLI